MCLFDGDGLLVSVELQNELFQVEEGLLVLGPLSHLHHTLPVVCVRVFDIFYIVKEIKSEGWWVICYVYYVPLASTR